MLISLWMCSNAIYHENNYLTCSKGHNLGGVHARMVKKGTPLVCLICQDCSDADIMGDNLQKGERGWAWIT